MGGMAKGKVANLLVFEIDPQAKLSSVKFYPKTVTNAALPAGTAFMGAGLVGQIMKAQGDFDYQFMQKNDDNAVQRRVRQLRQGEKRRSADLIIGNVAFGDNGKYAVDKIELPSGPTMSFLYPAKPGYVMIADYFKKKSQLGMKLVKLNI